MQNSGDTKIICHWQFLSSASTELTIYNSWKGVISLPCQKVLQAISLSPFHCKKEFHLDTDLLLSINLWCNSPVLACCVAHISTSATKKKKIDVSQCNITPSNQIQIPNCK